MRRDAKIGRRPPRAQIATKMSQSSLDRSSRRAFDGNIRRQVQRQTGITFSGVPRSIGAPAAEAPDFAGSSGIPICGSIGVNAHRLAWPNPQIWAEERSRSPP